MIRYPWLIGLCVLAGLAIALAVLVRSGEGELDSGGSFRIAEDGKAPAVAPFPVPDAATTATAPPVSAPRKDEELRAKLVGTWQDDYEGKRTMTLRSDGTGAMVVELSGLKAALVAPRLTFHMQWSVAQGRLKKRSLGGEPVVQVNMILKTLGDTVEEEILEATEDRLLLLDPDGKTKYDWRRMR